MAWETSDRRQELPSNWNGLVSQVKSRDGGRCVWRLPSGKRCPRAGRDVDHIGDPSDHSLRNLRLLCGDHHDARTRIQAIFAKRKAAERPRRAVEQHPGMVRR